MKSFRDIIIKLLAIISVIILLFSDKFFDRTYAFYSSIVSIVIIIYFINFNNYFKKNMKIILSITFLSLIIAKMSLF